MKERILSMLGGFVLSLGIIILAVYFFSRSTAVVPTQSVQQPDPLKLQEVGDTTQGLTNYGNLPKQVQNSDVGRVNPFDNY